MLGEPGPASDPDGAATPQSVALAWVEAVMDRCDLAAAWPITDPTLRLVLVQEWLWAHRTDPLVAGDDLDGLASLLARHPPEHFLWDRFAEDRLAEWHSVWRGFSSRSWQARQQPEIVDLDLEIVTMTEADRDPAATGAAPLARRFLLRHTERGWAVAGVSGGRVFKPGWPPSPA